MTDKRRGLLDWCVAFMGERMRSPTYQEIADGCPDCGRGVQASKHAAWLQIAALCDLGYLRKADDGQSVKVLRLSDGAEVEQRLVFVPKRPARSGGRPGQPLSSRQASAADVDTQQHSGAGR